MNTFAQRALACAALTVSHATAAHDVANSANDVRSGAETPASGVQASPNRIAYGGAPNVLPLRRSLLIGLGIDPDQSKWIPVPDDASAWRPQASGEHGAVIGAATENGRYVDSQHRVVNARGWATRGDECPAFIFRSGFDSGTLIQEGGIGSTVVYTSSGGYRIHINLHTITITDMLGSNRVEHWGDPHENLNGKHIKDWAGAPGWDGSQRTILLGDGTKVTMTAQGAQGLVTHTSIYDDQQNVQVANAGNQIVHHGVDPLDTQARDDAQHDGETALFESNANDAVATYTNIYNENAAFQRVDFNVPLGRTGGCANPGQVNDYFDDPRLGHT